MCHTQSPWSFVDVLDHIVTYRKGVVENTQIPQPLWIRGVQRAALIDIHIFGFPGNSGLTALLRCRTTDLYLPTSLPAVRLTSFDTHLFNVWTSSEFMTHSMYSLSVHYSITSTQPTHCAAVAWGNKAVSHWVMALSNSNLKMLLASA